MMSVKKKSRLWPIWGCLCSVAWATCSGIIRLSLKISSGFFGVVSLVPWLIRESSLVGFARAGSFHVGEEWKVLWLLRAGDGILGWEDGSVEDCWEGRWILPPWELLWHQLGRPRAGAAGQEEPRERQQLPLTKITPLCGSSSSVPGVTLGDVLW